MTRLQPRKKIAALTMTILVVAMVCFIASHLRLLKYGAATVLSGVNLESRVKLRWMSVRNDTTTHAAGSFIERCGLGATDTPVFFAQRGFRTYAARFINYPSSPEIQTWYYIHAAYAQSGHSRKESIRSAAAPGWVGISVEVTPTAYRIFVGDESIEVQNVSDVIKPILAASTDPNKTFIATYATDDLPFFRILALWDELEEYGIHNKILLKDLSE